jgi:hypothetical protein
MGDPGVVVTAVEVTVVVTREVVDIAAVVTLATMPKVSSAMQMERLLAALRPKMNLRKRIPAQLHPAQVML